MKRYHANRNRLTLTILILSLFAGNWTLKAQQPVEKLTVAVLPTQSRMHYRFPYLSDQLIHNLVNSNQYTVVDSLSLTNGRLNSQVLTKAQEMGVDAILQLTVTVMDQRTGSQFSTGLGQIKLGRIYDLGINLSQSIAHAEVVLRAFDPYTGKILTSVNGRGTSTGTDVGLDLDYVRIAGSIDQYDLGMRRYQMSSLGKAMQRAIDNALGKVQLTAVIPQGNEMAPEVNLYKGLIAEVDDEYVYLNGGRNAGLEPGMRVAVSSVSKVIRDPATGEVLDTMTEVTAVLVIEAVRNRIAIANRLLPDGQIADVAIGDAVELID
ncbi:MAG: CsgG/HfaB family protein [Pirellulales bacterium]|nr:CsgG/HfaB family protein [Pirellulales bacterium]